MQITPHRNAVAIFVSGFCLLTGTLSASASTTSWTGAAGNAWSNSNNWNNGLPGSGDTAYINGPSTVTLDTSNAQVSDLRISDGSNNVNLTIGGSSSSASLTAGTIEFGRRNGGTSVIDQKAGSVGVTGVLAIAGYNGGGDTSTYKMEDGSLTASNIDVNSQRGGNGSLIQTGGAVTVSGGYMRIGGGATGPGTYTISAGSLDQTGNGSVGVDANGTLTIDGSSVSHFKTTGFRINSSSSTLAFVLDSGGVSAIQDSGTSTNGGTMALAGTLDVSLNGYAGTGPVTLIDYGSVTRSGTFNKLDFHGFSANIDYSTNNQVRLTNISVPEPASLLLAIGGAALMLPVRRRRSSSSVFA